MPKVIFDRKETKDPVNPWQIELLSELAEMPSDRKIVWYVDTSGATGKSELIDWLMSNYPQDFLSATAMKDMASAAFLVKKALKNKWTSHGFLLNLVRDATTDSSPYAYLEAIKDGRMTSTKYGTETLCFRKPHVVVFANTFPDRSKFSEDRLVLREILKPSYSAREMSAPGVPKVAEVLKEELAILKHEEKMILEKLRGTRERIKACQLEIRSKRARTAKRCIGSSTTSTTSFTPEAPQCVLGISSYIKSKSGTPANIHRRLKRD